MANSIASPLAGKTILITRAALQSGELFEELSARGAIVKLLPLISFATPEDYAPMDAALKSIESFDWIFFTSANAVQAVERRGEELGRSLNALSEVAACCGGRSSYFGSGGSGWIFCRVCGGGT